MPPPTPLRCGMPAKYAAVGRRRRPTCRGTRSRDAGPAASPRGAVRRCACLEARRAGRPCRPAECRRRGRPPSTGRPARSEPSGSPRAACAAAVSTAGFRPFRRSRPPRYPRAHGIACDALRAGLRVGRAIDVAVQPYGRMSPFARRSRSARASRTSPPTRSSPSSTWPTRPSRAGISAARSRADRSRSSFSGRATAPACPSRWRSTVSAVTRSRSSTPRSSSASAKSAADISRILDRYADGIVARLVSHRDLVTIAARPRVPGDQRADRRRAPVPGARRLHDRAVGDRAARRRDRRVHRRWEQRLHVLDLRRGAARGAPPGDLPARLRAAAGGRREGRRLRAPGTGFEITHDAAPALRDTEIIYTDVWTSMGQETEQQRRREDFAFLQVNDAPGRARAAGGPGDALPPGAPR